MMKNCKVYTANEQTVKMLEFINEGHHMMKNYIIYYVPILFFPVKMNRIDEVL